MRPLAAACSCLQTSQYLCQVPALAASSSPQGLCMFADRGSVQLATLPESKLWTGEAWDSEQGPTSASEGSRVQDKPAGGVPAGGQPAGGEPAAAEPAAADEAADKLAAAPEQLPGAAAGSARRSKAGRLRQASAERDSPSVSPSSFLHSSFL